MPKAGGKRKCDSAGTSANVSNNVSSILNDVLQTTGQQSDQLVVAFVTAITKLGDVVKNLDATLNIINERLEKVESELYDVKVERDALILKNKQLEKELEIKTTQLEVDTEFRQREHRANNIKLTGMDVRNKTNVEIVDDIIKLHNDNVDGGNDTTKIDRTVITSLHIIRGRMVDSNKKPDAVIVSLQNVGLKKRFYALSKKMREQKTQTYIGDDLTVGQRRLLFELKKRTDLFQRAMIRDGVVRCIQKNGGIRQFAYLHELQKLPPIHQSVDAADHHTNSDE